MQRQEKHFKKKSFNHWTEAINMRSQNVGRVTVQSGKEVGIGGKYTDDPIKLLESCIRLG
jgi:hypothetical protein